MDDNNDNNDDAVVGHAHQWLHLQQRDVVGHEDAGAVVACGAVGLRREQQRVRLCV